MRARIELDGQLEDGTTLRGHLEQLEEATGKPCERLQNAAPPPAGERVWGWFWDLSDGRPNNGFGEGAIPYQEIQAWKSVTGERPEPWEIKAIRAMDGAFLLCCQEQQQKRNKSAKRKR